MVDMLYLLREEILEYLILPVHCIDEATPLSQILLLTLS